MPDLFDILAFICIAVLVVSKSLAIGFYDSLLRRQFESYPDVWAKEGSHRGMNWKPESSKAVSFFGQAHAWGDWLVKTPRWVLADQAARGTLSRFRMAEGVAAAALVILLIALIARHG